jgi:hypothetical protein
MPVTSDMTAISADRMNEIAMGGKGKVVPVLN